MAEKKIWEMADLRNFNLSDQDIRFLCTYGLEVGTFGCIDIYPEFEIKDSCVVLGYDSDVPICCCENGSGVISIEDDNKRFVNSTAETFSRTIARFSMYCDEVANASSEEDALAVVNLAIDEMKKIDSEAWSKEVNYWPIIGQQMIEGNL